MGAEALTDDIAEKIWKVFKCPVFDRYSDMELGIIAQREYDKTYFKINSASYYFECLKLNSDEWADEGEVGRLVFTDLYNHVFPMIRYDTGDLGSYINVNGEIFINKIFGRVLDQIQNTSGIWVNPHDITRIMKNIEGVIQWQLIQKSIDRFVFKVLRNKKKLDQSEIIKRLKSILGNEAEIIIEEVNEMPVLNSQKRKTIVNEMLKK